MRQVTACKYLGERKVEGCDHHCDAYQLRRGSAWQISPEDSVVGVVEVGDPTGAVFLYTLRWIDGRTVAEFQLDGVTYAQPIREDPRARSRLKDSEELAKPRKRAQVLDLL